MTPAGPGTRRGSLPARLCQKKVSPIIRFGIKAMLKDQLTQVEMNIAKFIFRITPLRIRRFLAFCLAKLAYLLLLKRRRIVIQNLTLSFPDKTRTEIIRIAKKMYVNFALMVMEFSDILYLNKDNLDKSVAIEGLDHYIAACHEGKGVLLFGAHFGNWEIGNAALAITTKPFVFVYRIFYSAFLENCITYVRASYGNTSLSKKKTMRTMVRLLKKGETINILIDQKASRKEGVFVDFFGRMAATTPGLAMLALYTGASVLPAFTRRLPDGKYLLEIGPKVEIVNNGNRDSDVLINTQNFTKIIEEYVRKYPDQWLWVHDRWKTKPPVVKSIEN